MTDQINQGGAQNQEKQPPEQTGSFKPPKQPVGPYSRDRLSGENPEIDHVNEGDEGCSTKEQGVVRDDRGQEQPADKKRTRQTSSRRQHGRVRSADSERQGRRAVRAKRKKRFEKSEARGIGDKVI